jgi:phage shock protein E
MYRQLLTVTGLLLRLNKSKTRHKNVMKKSILIFALLVFWSCGPSGSDKSSDILSPQAFAEQLHSNAGIILLDVRTPEEMQTGFVEGARNVDFNSGNFESALDSLDHSKKYFVYCKIGKRSGKAQEMMKSKGFQDVTSMEGGLDAWVAAGLPVQKP